MKRFARVALIVGLLTANNSVLAASDIHPDDWCVRAFGITVCWGY